MIQDVSLLPTNWFYMYTPQHLQKCDYALFSERFPHYTILSRVRDLRVTVYSYLTSTKHNNLLAHPTSN